MSHDGLSTAGLLIVNLSALRYETGAAGAVIMVSRMVRLRWKQNDKLRSRSP